MALEHIAVAVIGAGPYGLSVSAHLKARRVAHRVFGRPMSMWSERMPRGMYLKSEGLASNLSDPSGRHTLREFCAREGLEYGDVGTPVSLQTFVAYGRWFQQQVVPELEPLDVVRVEQAGRGFLLHLSDGTELTADRVILAVGVGAFAYVPPELQALPAQYVSHTSAHHDLSGFAGRTVTLVGGGQSALETAVLLREAGAFPQVLVREDCVHWNEAPLGRSTWARICAPQTPMGASWKLKLYLGVPDAFRFLPPAMRAEVVRTKLGPAGAWWLHERFADRVPLTCAMALQGLEASGGRVRITLHCGAEGPRVVESDHVMAATGYRMDLSRLGFLHAELRARIRTYRGFPQLSRCFESSVPRLHFVGMAAAHTYGPIQRFVHGAGLAAERVSAAAGRA